MKITKITVNANGQKYGEFSQFKINDKFRILRDIHLHVEGTEEKPIIVLEFSGVVKTRIPIKTKTFRFYYENIAIDILCE